MATYGAQPRAKQQTGGISASLASNRPENNGLFADLFSSQPSPKKLTVPQKDLLVFFRQLAVILQSGVPLAQGLLLIAENMTNQRSCYGIETPTRDWRTSQDEGRGLQSFKRIQIGNG